MFENYVDAKTMKRGRWKSLLITTSVVLHLIVGMALIIRGFWVIEKLALPKRELTLSIAPPPPPPPPPPAPSKNKVEPKKTVNKVRPMDTTQPVDKPPDEDEDVDIEIVPVDMGVEGGVEGGVAGGMIGGVVGGALEGVPGGTIEAPPPPPPPPKPRVVPQVAVEQQRIAGDKNILPDDSVRLQMQRDGKNQIVATVKMCLTVTGSIASVNMLRSSGYPAYDRKIRAQMGEWRYSPFRINGNPVPVCTTVTFIYRQM